MALYGFRERIIIYFRWLTVLPNWGIRYWMWQLGQRPIHRQIFRVDILLIAPNLLFGQGKETSLFQLRFDEADKWRQADDRCVAFACHCPVGKIVWQAPHSKAISIVKSHNNGIYRARRMGARSFLRKLYHRHCSQFVRSSVFGYRTGTRICSYESKPTRRIE